MSALYLSRCVSAKSKFFSFDIISGCPTDDHYRLSVTHHMCYFFAGTRVHVENVWYPFCRVIECKGPTNGRTYTVAVYFKGKRLAVGHGHNIQQAEMNSATKALESYKGNETLVRVRIIRSICGRNNNKLVIFQCSFRLPSFKTFVKKARVR